MSCIHYKFKSSLDYNSVTFDGLHLSLGDLKKAISAQKRLKLGEFELEIINAQTGDVYKKSDELIAKNTSVIVSRVPLAKTNANSTQRSWEAFKQNCAKVKEQERQKMLELEEQKKAQEAASVPSSEMDKIKAVIDQSTKGFEPSSFQGRHPHSVPNDTYVCKRCGNKGHYITHCPNIKQEDRVIEPRVKRTTGIPSTMLTIVDDPLHPGALLNHFGQFAVPTVDVQGYKDTKKDQPPFSGEKNEPEIEKKIIPKELLCHICEDLCVDAAIAPCCGTSFCDECLREELLESEDHQCPSCHETNVSPDRIVANRSMRIAVTNFLNDSGYTKVKRRRSSSASGDIASMFPHPAQPRTPPDTPPPTTSSSPPPPPPSSLHATGASISSVVDQIPSSMVGDLESMESSIQSLAKEGKGEAYPRFQTFRGQNSYKPWHQHEHRYPRPPFAASDSSTSLPSHGPSFRPSHSQPFIANIPPPPVMAAAAAAASQAIQALVGGQRLPHLLTAPHPGFPTGAPPPNYLQRYMPPRPQAPLMNAQRAVSLRKKPDVFDSFADFTRKRSRTPELRSRSRSRSGSPPRRSSQSSYSPVKIGSHGRSPRRSSLSRSRSRSRTGSFRRSRSGGRLSRSPKRSRSKSPPPRRRTERDHSRGLSKLRSISPGSITKRSRSRSGSPYLKAPLRKSSRSRSRSRSSFKRSYRSRSKSWSRSKKARSRSYTPLSPRRSSLPPLRRSLDRSPRRSPYRSSRSPRRSPGRSPLYSPIRSRSKKSFSPRRRSRSFSPKRRSPLPPLRSKSRSPYGKQRSAYSRSRSPAPPPSKKRSTSPYSKSRRTPSPYSKGNNKRRTPSPFQNRRGGDGYKDSKYPRDDFRSGDSKYTDDNRGGPPRQRYSPPRRGSSPSNNSNGPPFPNPASGNLPPVPSLPGLPPPEEYFKNNPLGYEEFLRTFYAQFGQQPNQANQANKAHAWPGEAQQQLAAGQYNNHQQQHQHQHAPQPSGPSFGNSYPLGGQPNAPPHHHHQPPPLSGFPQDRRQQAWDSEHPSNRPRSVSPPYGDRYRRERDNMGRPGGFDNRGNAGGGYKDKKFDDNQRFGERNHWRGADYNYSKKDEQRYDDGRKWRGGGDYKDRRVEESKDRKFIPSEIRDKRGSRDCEKRGRDENEKRSRDYSEKRGRDEEKRSKDGDRTKSNQLSKDVTKSKEHERKRSPQHGSKHEKSKKVEDKKKKEEKENIENKTKADLEEKQVEAKEERPNTKTDNENSDLTAKSVVTPLEDAAQVKTQNISDGTEVNVASSQETTVVKEKKVPGKKKVGAAGKKLKAKAAVGPNGKKIKKKKLTFGASETDKGLKKKKIKRVVDYKSENNCTSEDAADTENKGNLSEPSPMKKAKLESDNIEGVADSEKVESSADAELSNENNIQTDTQESPSRAVAGDEEKDLSTPEKAKSGVMTELPELSKWERDDFDIADVEKPEEKPKEKTTSLPRSVVDKAEKFLVEKPMKNSVVVASVAGTENNSETVDKQRNSAEKQKEVQQERPRSVSEKEKYSSRDTVPNRAKEREAYDRRDDRHRGQVERRKYSQEERRDDYDRYRDDRDYDRYRDDRRKDYRDNNAARDYRFGNSSKDVRSKSPIYTKDYRHRSKSPVYNRDYRSKSPIHTKDYRSKSPSGRSRKVHVDSKKDHQERKSFNDITVTVKGDRHGTTTTTNTKKSSHRYQDDMDEVSDEDERSVVRSHSLEKEMKSSKIRSKKTKEDGKDKSTSNEKSKKVCSKLKKKKSKDDSNSNEKEVVSSTTTSNTSSKKDNPSKVKEDISAPHRSPRDLRHKLEEKTKSQINSSSSNVSTSGQQKKLSVMDESEFVPDYEDNLAPETTTADNKDPSVSPARTSSPEHKEQEDKDKAVSDDGGEKSSDDEEGEGGDEEEKKEGKKHKKSKKKHKKKEKKEKHKHKKKKHKKNKEKDDE